MTLDVSNLVRVLIKSMGIVFVVYAIFSAAVNVSGALAWLEQPDIQVFYATYMIPHLTWLIVGILLWVFPRRVSNTIVAQVSHEDIKQFEVILLSIVGLVIACLGLSLLAYDATTYFQTRNAPLSFQLKENAPAAVARDLAMIAISFIFIFGAQGLIALIRRYRDAG